MIGLSLGLLILAQSHQNSVDKGAQADIVYNRAWINDNEEPWIDAPIKHGVNANTLNLISKVNGNYSMIGLECETLKSDGGLSDCELRTSPTNLEMVNIAKKMQSDIKLDQEFARAHRKGVKLISIQVRISNSDTSITSGPCWPPTCSSTPLPPPLPLQQ